MFTEPQVTRAPAGTLSKGPTAAEGITRGSNSHTTQGSTAGQRMHHTTPSTEEPNKQDGKKQEADSTEGVGIIPLR